LQQRERLYKMNITVNEPRAKTLTYKYATYRAVYVLDDEMLRFVGISFGLYIRVRLNNRAPRPEVDTLRH